MSQISGESKDLIETGIIIDIEVVYNRQKSHLIKALIDTGASGGCIDLEILKDLTVYAIILSVEHTISLSIGDYFAI